MVRPIISSVGGRVISPIVQRPLGSLADGIVGALLPHRTNASLGLLLGLRYPGADSSWALRGNARHTSASQATARVVVGSTSMTITLPSSLAEGAAGNEWQIVLGSDPISSTITVSVERNNKIIRIITDASGFNFNIAAGYINTALGAGSAVVANYDSSNTWPGSGSVAFTGGTSVENIHATAIPDEKQIWLFYSVDDRFSAFIGVGTLNVGHGQLFSRLVKGTALDDLPVFPSALNTTFNRRY